MAQASRHFEALSQSLVENPTGQSAPFLTDLSMVQCAMPQVLHIDSGKKMDQEIVSYVLQSHRMTREAWVLVYDKNFLYALSKQGR
jgi:hypothetical protein